MNYISNILGLKVESARTGIEDKVPFGVLERYHIEKVLLDGMPVFLAFPRNEIDTAYAVSRHIAAIRKQEDIPVVIMADRIPFRKRKRFIEERIPFVEEGSQIYLPFIGTYLTSQDKLDSRKSDKLSPAAQMLLIYLILKGGDDNTLTSIAQKLKVSGMTISRASHELQDLELVNLETDARRISIYTGCSSKELLEKSLPFMTNPVKRRLYIKKENKDDILYVSNMSALSRKSMMAAPHMETYASGLIAVVLFKQVRHLMKLNPAEVTKYD